MPERRSAGRTADAPGSAGRQGPTGYAFALHGLALLVLLLAAGRTLAHKLNIFAAADGRLVEGEVYFAAGAKAAGVPITIMDAAGEVLARLHSSADGSFSYQASAPLALRIVAETPDGHRAEWRIAAAELAGAIPMSVAAVPGNAVPPDGERPVAEILRDDEAPGTPRPQPSSGADAALGPGLEAAIERAVARQVRPLRQETRVARDAVRLRDVLGGIGYIVGLAGLGLWWQCRRTRGGP